MFAILHDCLQGVSSNRHKTSRRIRIERRCWENGLGHPVPRNVHSNGLVALNDVSYQRLLSLFKQIVVDVETRVVPEIVICSHVVCNVRTVVIGPVVGEDGEKSEVHEMIAHVELDDVMITVILFTDETVSLFVVFVLTREEEMNHLVTVDAPNVAPGFTRGDTLGKLTGTDRTANDNVNAIVTSMRVVDNGLVGVRILHRHIFDPVLLAGIHTVLAVVQETLFVGGVHETIVHRFRLIE